MMQIRNQVVTVYIETKTPSYLTVSILSHREQCVVPAGHQLYIPMHGRSVVTAALAVHCARAAKRNHTTTISIARYIIHVKLPRSKAAFTPSASRRVASTTFGLLASNVCTFIQLSITSFSVTSSSMTSFSTGVVW